MGIRSQELVEAQWLMLDKARVKMIKRYEETFSMSKQRINKQIACTMEVLKALKGIDSLAVAAGGAPRDWVMNSPANDIDIYFRGKGAPVTYMKQLLDMLKPLGTASDDLHVKEYQIVQIGDFVGEDEDQPYTTMRNIELIWEFTYEGEDFQLMQLYGDANMGDLLEDFSSPICGIQFDGLSLDWTEDYALSMASKCLWLSGGYSWLDPHPAKMWNRFKDQGFKRVVDSEWARKLYLESILKEKQYHI